MRWIPTLAGSQDGPSKSAQRPPDAVLTSLLSVGLRSSLRIPLSVLGRSHPALCWQIRSIFGTMVPFVSDMEADALTANGGIALRLYN
jgi:hypothetical protein